MNNQLTIYDTSLRDGLQGEKINLNLNEKLKIVTALDKIGIHYIEGGFPLASEQEMEFFRQVEKLPLKKSKIASFGSTKKPLIKVEDDYHMNAFIEAGTKVVTIVGKSHVGHVKEVLKTTLDENLNMIRDSIKFLKENDKEVIYDAEHFFDGYLANSDYALKTITTAKEAGADMVVLCDTNGGMIHTPYLSILEAVSQISGLRYGVHLHNDTGYAVANSMMALDKGALQVQGTLNGWGERCGNTELATVMANLHFKLGSDIFTDEEMMHLTQTCRYLDEIANLSTNEKRAYVGRSAFAHKAGQHADVILKKANLMEHIDSERVGNSRRILLSELAGKASVLFKLNKFGSFDKNSPEVLSLTESLKKKEQLGYEFEAAEASFELIILKELGKFAEAFKLLEYRVEINQKEDVSKDTPSASDNVWAFIKIAIGDEVFTGDAYRKGPVDALDQAFRKAVAQKYAFINQVYLKDYKVRVLGDNDASASKVRVFIESSLHDNSGAKKTWGTIGVSPNIIAASWEALKDAFDYAFYHFKQKK